MAQVADIVDRVVRQLLSGTVEERNKLAASLSTSATSVTLSYELGGVRAGSVIQVGSEQMYVWEATTGTKTLTVERGFNGTDPSTHPTGAIVTNNPRFPRNQVLEAINAELDDLSSPVNGLYRMVTVELSYNGTDRMIDLTGASNVLELYEVRYRYLATDYPRLRNVSLVRDMPVADFPSGLGIILNDPFPRSGTLVVSYKSGFGSVSQESEDLQLVSGLPASADDVVVLELSPPAPYVGVDRFELALKRPVVDVPVCNVLRDRVGCAGRYVRHCRRCGEGPCRVFLRGQVDIEGDVVPLPTRLVPAHRSGQDGGCDGRGHHGGDGGAEPDVGEGRGVHDRPLEQRKIRAVGQSGRPGVGARDVGHRNGQLDGIDGIDGIDRRGHRRQAFPGGTAAALVTAADVSPTNHYP